MTDKEEQFYWELLTKDGDRIEIPPSGVEVVKRRWDRGEVIHTAHSGSIPASQIKTFRPTSRQADAQPLLEAAAQAFNEPIYTEEPGPNGMTYRGIRARWVKKRVPYREYQSHYSKVPSYRSLGTENGMAIVAFTMPVHQIDITILDYCTDTEVSRLTRI